MTENNDSQLANADMIRNSPLGTELSDSQCQALSEKVTVMGLKEGQFLIDEGEKDNSLYVIISGHLEVLIRSAGGDLVTLHLLREGEMAGELFETFIEQDPDLMYKVMRAIIRTVHSILCDMNKSHVEMNNYIYKQHGRY